MCDENDNLVLIDFGLSLDCGLKPHPIGCGTPGKESNIYNKYMYIYK